MTLGNAHLTPNAEVPADPAAGSAGVADPVLEIRGLCVDYGLGDEAVHPVVDCDLVLRRGHVLGLAGESGSGKSTLAMATIRLLRWPGVITAGEVLFHSKPASGERRTVDVLSAGEEELRSLRWSEISVVPQSALNSLNPVATTRAQFDDLLRVHRRNLSAAERVDRAVDLLEMVGLTADRLRSYPHEPSTALDVVTQREILEELMSLRDRLGFAALFITHDLSLLIELADEIAVMYAGRIVEKAPATSLFRSPRMPYTHGLLHCFPPMHGERAPMEGIPGSPPDLRALPHGCAFHPRCPWAMERCRSETPTLVSLAESGRTAACWLHAGDVSVPQDLDLPDPLQPAPGAMGAAAPRFRRSSR